MTRSWTRTAALALLLVAAFRAPVVRAEEKDPEVSPYPLVFRSDDRPDVVSTTVVDARTGRPIVGASVRGYAEEVSGLAAAVNALVCDLKTNELGLASARLDTKELGCSHWVISAKGYRPYADYHGYWPPMRVTLEPGTPMAVRIEDVMGRPVANAEVEAFTGCPHAPPAVRGRTDVDGVFRVKDGSPDGYELWVQARDFACSPPGDLLPVFGDSPSVQVLEPGIEVRGRVSASDGRPIHGAVVRGTDYPRGPSALTDAEGRFQLQGLGPHEGIKVLHPTLSGDAERSKMHVVDSVVADVPLDLVWTLGGFDEPDARGTLEVHARDGSGAPVTDLRLLVIGPDGRARNLELDAEGDASLPLAIGEYRIRGDSPFDAFDVAEAKAQIVEDKEATVSLILSPRPRLRIDGDIPADFGAGLTAAGRVYGDSLVATKRGPAAPVWLPAGGPAALMLSTDQGTWRQSVLVGPPVDGARTAVVKLPPAHRIRVAAGDEMEGDSFFVSPAEHPDIIRAYEIVHGVISIRRGGRYLLHLNLENGSPTRFLTLDLPPLSAGAVERTIDVTKDGAPDETRGRARLVVTMADGSPVPEMDVSGERFTTNGAESPVEVNAPETVLLSPRGFQPLSVWVDKAGERKVLFPMGGVDLSTVDASGAAVRASLLIDGIEHDAVEGALKLRGLTAGAHAVIVQRNTWPPRVSGAVLWRFTLAEGEVRSKTLTLP